MRVLREALDSGSVEFYDGDTLLVTMPLPAPPGSVSGDGENLTIVLHYGGYAPASGTITLMKFLDVLGNARRLRPFGTLM